MKNKKRSVVLITLIALIFAIGVILLTGFLCSQRLAVDEFPVSADINAEVKLCQISDLHVPYQGVDLGKIIAECKNLSPDLFLLTGDIFDGKAQSSDLNAVSGFLFELRKLAPVYAVLGNHEIGSPHLSGYKKLCVENGVNLLINESAPVTVNGVNILITGLNDGNVFSEKNLPDYTSVLDKSNPEITLLLAHRPELTESYSAGKFTAIFTGHAHGGQVRIFNHGLYAPDQGMFPKYTSGEYRYENTKMFVSRGLGDGYNSFRIFNSYNINLVRVR